MAKCTEAIGSKSCGGKQSCKLQEPEYYKDTNNDDSSQSEQEQEEEAQDQDYNIDIDTVICNCIYDLVHCIYYIFLDYL